MANYQNLLNSIAAVIKTNGNQEITGAVLQSTLQSMVSVMGANATYGGVAHPTDSPGTPDGPVVYVASEMGIYTNFGAISIDADELAMLKWNPTTGTWSKESIAYIADKSEIEQVIEDGIAAIEEAKDDAIEEIENEFPGSTDEVAENETKLTSSRGVYEWARDDMGLFGTVYDTVVDKDGAVGSTYWISLGYTLAANTTYRVAITAISKAANLSSPINTKLSYNGSNTLTLADGTDGTAGAVTTWVITTTRTYNRLQFVNGSKAFSFHVKIEKVTNWKLSDKVNANTTAIISVVDDAKQFINDVCKDTTNLMNIDGYRSGGYYNDSGSWMADADYDSYHIRLAPSTNYYYWRGTCRGKSRLFDNTGTRIWTQDESGSGNHGYAFTTGEAEYYDLYLGVQKSYGNFATCSKTLMCVVGNSKPAYFIPWYSLLGTNYSKDIYELKNIVDPSFYQKAMMLNSESFVIKPLCCKDKDILHVHTGSSSSAWQASENLAPEGVCEVPATCDRQGLAYGLWVNSVFGNPLYRRYDYGKKSLVGEYSDKWADDTDAFFSESGEWNSAYGNFTNAASSRTTLDTLVSPIPFDSAGYDMHIPRRYSNGNASGVSFTIPAGYSRFSFIYNNNILGDDITITTDRANGIVTKADNIAMTNAVEANNGTFSTLYTGSATNVGYPNQMVHFAISDTSVTTTITLNKSADTTKYFIYWGIVYWGTAKEPYAHIFANNARGGANTTTLNSHKAGTVGALKPNFVTYQIPTTNNIGENPDFASAATMTSAIGAFKTYCDGLSADVAFQLQHRTKEQADSNLKIVKDIYGAIVRYLDDNNLVCIGNLARLFDKIHQCYYPDLTYSQFVSLVSADKKHLNTDGLACYKALFSSINNN